MNNFVNIKKLEKIYYSQEFLKGISFLGGGGEGDKKKTFNGSTKLFNRKLSLKAFKLINRM